MAEYQEFLAALSTDPSNDHALAAIEAADARVFHDVEIQNDLDSARTALRERGQLDIVAKLFDVEIEAAADDTRRADLLLERGQLSFEDLLDETTAIACFHRVLELRPGDDTAQESLAHIGLVRDNWRKFVEKYLEEAKVSTDRQLTTSLYLSAAEIFARYEPHSGEVEQYLRRALEVDSRNRKAAIHLERLLRRDARWAELIGFLEQRVDAAVTKEERVHALLGIAEVAEQNLGDHDNAVECMKKVVATEPAHPRALRILSDAYEATENWSALVMLYTNGLKASRRTSPDSDIGMLLQIAMLHWKRIDNIDAAEEYFRRIRKADPAHPAALDFYRQYYPERNEVAKLLQVLRQAQKSVSDEEEPRRHALSIEIAEIAETQLGNPEKAIDSWKQILRGDSGSREAHTALRRLYRKTEKWNALLDLMKDEIEHLPADDVDGRVQRLMEIVEIYRDRLKLDVMVINTYNTILKLDPHNRHALDDLVEKYKQLGRWNDLIAVLAKKAESPTAPIEERAAILREIATLWSERFGNYAQAIKPLEQLIELCPDDLEASGRLKEIYTRRRQWRALIDLLNREVARQPIEERRAPLIETARLASDRLGDQRLAIELWNRLLELPGHGADAEALEALSQLYDREKRYLALAEIYRRQRDNCRAAGDSAAAIQVLERLGALLADRLQVPAAAAEAFREILDLDPGHGRALRTLRELYASAGDYAALEGLYASLDQWEELVDAFFAISDRLQEREPRLALLERTAAIAAAHFDNLDKVARAYERILSVDSRHREAARALVPIYEKTEKWPRLLSTYEILLEHADTDPGRLELHLKIRDLCEAHLGSKALAFQWTARAFDLDPDNRQLLADLERLGADADAWAEVATILDRRLTTEDSKRPLDEPHRVELLRELGKISMVRLHAPERARGYQRQLLQRVPDDPEAMDALEEIATQLSEWPDLLKVYQRRAELAEERADKVGLLFKIAFINEERVADLDAAAATYKAILQLEPDSSRALVALAKIQEARGDWDGLADVLDRQLRQTHDTETQVELYLRLGGLYDNSLGRNHDALRMYQAALGLDGRRPQIHEALERFLDPAKLGPDAADSRREVASLLLPIYEQAEDPARIARAIEVLHQTSEGAMQLDYDRRLVALYGEELGDSARGYGAALRVLAAAPDDGANRQALLSYAATLDRDADLAAAYQEALRGSKERDSMTRRALAAELAALYEERLDQPDNAEKAWLEVLSIEPSDEPAYEALDRIYRGAGRWGDLRDLLRRHEQTLLETGIDAERRKSLLLAICDLEEGVLDNAPGAIDAYRRVIDIDPEYLRAYKALERLYAEAKSWAELEALYGDELSHVDPDDSRQEHIDLSFRRAQLRAVHLGDPAGAVDLLEDVVSRQRSHSDGRELLEELLPNVELRLRIARILEPLYQDDGLWRDLCLVLRAQREVAASPHDAVDLLSRVATIEEEQMSHERGAFDTWMEGLAVDCGAEQPRRALIRLAGPLDRWEDAARAFEQAVTDTPDGDLTLRAELLVELADIYDRHLADSERAMTTYRRLLDVDPGNPDTARVAAAALDRLYAEEQRWPDLIEIVRRQAEWAESGEDRMVLLARVAAINEEHLGDKAAAIATWREVVAEEPEDNRGLDALERLYSEAEQTVELIEVLRRRVERAGDAAEKKSYLRRIAALYEEKLADTGSWLAEAINAHLEVLDHVPDDRQTLAELARLYQAHQRYNDLLEILERRLALCDDDRERIELTFELGRLLDEHLERTSEALERFAEVLAVDPAHAGARAAVEKMLDREGMRRRAAEILEPLYEEAGEHRKLADLLVRLAAIHAETGTDPREHLRCLREVAELRESHLDDKAGAFAAYGDAVRAAVAEPDLPELVGQLQRLAADLGREGDLIDVFREVGPDVLDGDLQRRLYLDIADLARALRQDTVLAREYYQRVLDGAPDDSRALGALEAIYREAEEYDQLNEILVRKAELAVDNLDVRAKALAESAMLCAEALDRPEDAVMAWEQVLEIVPDHKVAADSLEKLYESSERWHDLVQLIERRLGFAFSVEEAVALRFRLGEIYEHQLLDPEAAVENYSAVLGGNPSHAGATEALERSLDEPGSRNSAAEVLEPIYVAHQDWPKLVRIYEIKLEAAENPDERLYLTRYIARLYEEQLEDLEGAFRWSGRVFRESPQDASVRDQLTRLATILENWEGLANIYQEYLEDELGHSPATRAAALALADICDRRTSEVERGQTAYRRVLQATPEDLDTFGRLEAMLLRGERWFSLVDVYTDAIQATMDDNRRQDLYTRMARVQRDHLKDSAAAIDAYRAVLDLNPENVEAASELDALFQSESQWFDLSELLASRIEHCADPKQANQYRMRLAEIMQQRLEDIQGAIDHYQVVLQSEVGWEAALAPLERLVLDVDSRERIAEILEPVYRAHDWWQKLVVILDAQLEYVDDPERQVEMLREIARIHETRGGDQRLALDALARAWKTNPQNETVYEELSELAAKLAAWNQLVKTLEAGIAEQYDYDLVARVLARIAEVHETQRGDNLNAIAAWRRALEVADEDPVALAALDRLYTAVDNCEELVGVVQRRSQMADDDEVRKALLHRIAELYEQRLQQPAEAISAYKNVLMVDDGDAEALGALERLYRAEGDWNELAAILCRKIDLADEPLVSRELHFAAAQVYDSKLNDAYEAISHLSAIIAADGGDPEALAALDAIYQRETMWVELIETLDRRAAIEGDPASRAGLEFRAAMVLEKELLEAPAAIDRYARVLAIDPQHAGAREALDAMTRNEDTLAASADVLEQLFRGAADFERVAELYERRLAVVSPDPGVRREQYSRLVEVHEISRGDLDAAFAVWARSLVEVPEDVWVQAQLERLAAARGSWDELAELYEQRLAAMVDAELEYAYATKLAGLYEEALGDLERAADKYRRALGVANDEREPLAALDRIYGRANRFEDLAEILAREAEATLEEVEQAEFLFRLGDVREQSLSDTSGAVLAYRDVLERAPQHSAARLALERLLISAETERAEIITILEPLYEGENEFGRLADLLVAKLGITSDRFERAQVYGSLAELAETKLGDPVRALDAVGGWLAEDPQSGEALAELDRLAEICNRWGEVAARLSGIVDSADSEDVRRPLLLKLGEVQLENLGDAEGAERTFRMVLDSDPDAGPALVALDRIYRQQGNPAALAEVVWRRGELALDAPHRRSCYMEAAGLREQLGDVAGAITAWQEVLELDEGDHEAHGALATIYQREQRWADLVEILGVAARFASGGGEELALRSQIAEIYTSTPGFSEEHLEDAMDAWQAVLDVDAESLRALDALHQVHTRREDWLAVQEILVRRLDMAGSNPGRIAVLLELADLARTKRESVDEAIGYLYQILDVDNAHFETYARLERILTKSERFHDLVELYDRLGEVYGALGNSEEEISCLAKAADVWEGALENPDAAGEILEKILKRDPNYVPALTRLAKIYESAGEWDRCSEILGRAVALGPTGRAAADLYYRLGEVERQQSGDREATLRHWAQALQFDPNHPQAVVGFEVEARERQDWGVVADMVARREAAASDPAEKLELTLDLADLFGKKLKQPGRVIPLLERAAALAPDDERVVGPLADLYFAAGDSGRAAPIYERLAEEAKKGRKMKEVAKYRQRLGGIFEAAGDIDKALAAYEEAFRVNPTDVATMAGLGRIYMARQTWEKARRVYRSMVLQNLDPDVGITKGEVYYHLGVIHLELGEDNKAKGMFQRGLEIEPDNQLLRQALDKS